MISLNSFRLDNSQSNSLKCVNDLKKFIEYFVGQEIFDRNLKKFSKILNCDLEPFKLKSQKLILEEFNFKKNSFNNFSSFFQIILGFLVFLYISLITIFSFKKKVSKKQI